ncbi:MAG: hypothetical protein K0R54_156 [Clostridiaceae bacterium]|jgi:hypothetical protein|nr:hypothetical protein [Clostridiaceae bacterium]
MLTIINLKNKKVEHYDYEEIYEGMKDVNRNNFFKQLYERNKLKEIHAYCTCVPDKEIPLVISKWKHTYYVKRQDASVEHSPTCKFDGEYVHSLKGWDVQTDGHINVSLKDRLFNLNSYNNIKTGNKLSLEEFVRRYMGFVWELQSKYFLKSNKECVTYSDFYTGLQYWASKIKFTERISLKEILGNSKSKSYSLLKQNLRMFVISQFERKEKIDKTTYLIYLKNPDNNYLIEVTCPIELWNEKYKALTVSKSPILVSGFVELIKDKPLNFVDFVIVPISNEGVVIDNEYEKKLFNALHKKKRVFVKSYETYRNFQNIKPNVMLIDSTPVTLVEIFEEDKTNNAYYEDKLNRLNYFNTLDNYKIILWDAFNNEKLFKF